MKSKSRLFEVRLKGGFYYCKKGGYLRVASNGGDLYYRGKKWAMNCEQKARFASARLKLNFLIRDFIRQEKSFFDLRWVHGAARSPKNLKMWRIRALREFLVFYDGEVPDIVEAFGFK